MLTKRERVKRVISGRDVDYIPYSFDITSFMLEKLAHHYDIKPQDVQDFIGDHLLYTGYGAPAGFVCEQPGDNTYKDEFGVVWERGSELHNIGDWGGIISNPLKGTSLKGYNFPDPYADGRVKYLENSKYKDSDKYVILAMDGIFDVGWHLRGFENLLMDFACEEKFVDELLEKVLEFNIGIIEQLPRNVDGIRFGEDWGQQKGLLMGAKFFRRFLKPRLRIMYQNARRRGFDVFIHSCGDIHEIFPDLIEMGVQVANPVQPEVMDVEWLKREYGHDLVLYGGMGCQSTIPNGSVRDVIGEAKRRLEVLGRDGGYIFGPAGAIPTDAKIDNVAALIDFVRNQYRQ